MKNNKKEKELIRIILSNNIKKYRKIFNYSQAKLAVMSGLSMQTLNDIEGCRRWVSSKTLSKIADALSVDEYQLLMPENKKSGVKTNEPALKSFVSLKENIKKMVEVQFEQALKTGKLK